MKVVYNQYPKLCHAKPGGLVRLLDEQGQPVRDLYMVCAMPVKGKRAGRELMMHGLYDDERPLFLVHVESGEAIPMPHLSSHVEIVHNAYLKVDEDEPID